MRIADLILSHLLPAGEKRDTTSFCTLACLLILAIYPLCGCSATVGRTHGDADAAFLPGWERIQHAAVKAARSTGTWASTVSTQKALAGDANTPLSGRSPITTPLYDVENSTNPVASTANPVRDNGATSFPQGTISVMAPAPVWDPSDGKQYDTVNALASAAVGHFVGALITNVFLDQDRGRQGFTPMVKGSKDGVLVSLNWSF